jgi:hypothetical protein
MTRVGITGHQRLDDPDAWAWVEQALGAELDKLGTPLIGITSLAVGADQLFARVVLARGGSLVAILPLADIERTFPPEALADFRELYSRSNAVILDTPGGDEEAFFAAGQRVVDTADLLLAVWDGKPQQSRGGTAEVVAYATDRGASVIHINPVARTVHYL